MEAHNEGIALVSGLGYLPACNFMLWSRNKVDTESKPPWQYYLGCKRKKNTIQARSVIFCFLARTPCTVASMQCNISMGVGCTLVGAGVISLHRNYQFSL